MSDSPANVWDGRRQHYEFAHRALPQMLHQQLEGLLNALTGPDAAARLREAWDMVGEALPPSERVAPDGLRHDLWRVGASRYVVAITLPPPRRTTEAYFVAGVLDMSGADVTARRVRVRVFTLEYSDMRERASEELLGWLRDAGYRPEALLCEWAPDGSHLNSGEAVVPEMGAFIATVLARLDGPVATA